MKCTSCVSSSRPKSDDDDVDVAEDDNGAVKGAVSPVRAMDKIEEEYRVESPPTVQPSSSSRIPPPSVSIVEVPPDYRGESSRIYDIGLEKQPSPSASNSSSHLLRPLDVITEENSDVSDTESRPSPPRRPDLCFPRPKARFKKAKSRNLLKSLLQTKQEPTTCVLLDTKIAEAAPEEYRSVCTTEVVPEEILEVEVIDLGSNSSSLVDLTDLDDAELDKPIGDDDVITSETCDNLDQINNNEYLLEENTTVDIAIDSANESRKPQSVSAASASSPSPSTPEKTDNDNEIDSETFARPPKSASESIHAEEDEKRQRQDDDDDEFSEEDNNGYGEKPEDEDGESKTSEIFTQPPQQAANASSTHHNDDDDDCNDYHSEEDDDGGGEYHENDRTESDRDDELGGSLLAGVDRAGVVTQQPGNVIEVKECIDEKNRDDVDVESSIDCSDGVTHPPNPNCSNRSGEEVEDRRPVIGDSAAVQSAITTRTAEMGESPEVEVVPKPPPLPSRAALAAAAAAPTVAEAPAPSTAAAVTNLGREDVSCGGLETTAISENAQIHSGSDTGEADSANADPDSEKDSVDAVVAASSSRGDSEESVLLKFLKDQPPLPLAEEASVENRPTFDEPSTPSKQPEQNSPVAATKIERTVKSEQLNYEIVQDHRLVRREETVTTSATSSSSSTNNNNNTGESGGGSGGSEVVLRRRGSKSSNSGKEPSPEQKAALVHDLRNEISRIKDAELQEEFRKLELEAARIEQELSQMATLPALATPLQVPSMTENLTYYVSKQNDFAAVVQKPPVVTSPREPTAMPPPLPMKPTNGTTSSGSVAKSSSNDQLYNEWQQKMEERETRRLHKVIKISKPNEPIPLPPPSSGGSGFVTNGSAAPEPEPDLGDEFLRKVKERRRKFTLPGGGSDSEYENGSAPNSTPGTPIAGRKPVPKHIEAEFAEFAELRKRQQQEEAQEQKQQQQQTSVVGESSSKEEDKAVDRRPPGMLVLASAIGIVVWSVFRVMFGRK